MAYVQLQKFKRRLPQIIKNNRAKHPQKNPISTLTEISKKYHLWTRFELRTNVDEDIAKKYAFELDWNHVDGKISSITGPRKESVKEAKVAVIEKMLMHVAGEIIKFPKDLPRIDGDFVQLLINYCQRKNLREPKFFQGSKYENNDGSFFTFCCKVGSIGFWGYGMKQKRAKKDAARGMLSLLKGRVPVDSLDFLESVDTDDENEPINEDDVEIEMRRVIPNCLEDGEVDVEETDSEETDSEETDSEGTDDNKTDNNKIKESNIVQRVPDDNQIDDYVDIETEDAVPEDEEVCEPMSKRHKK